MIRIKVENISKKFRIGSRKRQSFLARVLGFISGREQKIIISTLDSVTFSVQSGEILGIIGENGSGKSTLLRIIAGIYLQDSGNIKLTGKVISLINLRVGLRERLTMKENIYLVGSLFGLEKKEILKRFDSIVEFSELQNFINTKVYQFSEGMKQRLAFSIAIHSNPDILLLDEVFEVGDEDFKKKSVEQINKIVKKGGCVILVSHDMEMIKNKCNRVILIKKGRIFKEGETGKIIKIYKDKVK